VETLSGILARYKLSKQEQQVLILTMAGNADKDIAEKLGIQLDTVRTYWKRIRAKTDRSTRAEVIALIASEATHDELSTAQKENEVLMGEIVRRRGVEEELAIYREVFSRTCVGLAVDGGEGAAIIRLNEAFAQLHGYTTDELIGRPIEMLLQTAEKPSAEEVIKRTDQLGEALLTETHVRKDGSTFPVLKQVTSISEKNGRVYFRIYTVLDLNRTQSWQSFLVETKTKAN
jgi:PAS domain S-box-containing protein